MTRPTRYLALVPVARGRIYNPKPLFEKGITGRGQTIAIVDAFGSPTIAADLKTFE